MSFPKCPTYTAVQVTFLIGLANVLNNVYIAGLNSAIIHFLLYGNAELDFDTNPGMISVEKE